MPKVTIKEMDYTGASDYTYLDHTVLIPGIKLEYTRDVESGEEILDEEELKVSLNGLYEDPTSFKDKFNNILKEKGSEKDSKYSNDFGIIEAYECLKAGLSVEYIGVYDFIDNGEMKKIVVNTESGESSEELMTAADITNIFEPFADRGNYDLRFLTIGGIDKATQPLASTGVSGEFTGNANEFASITILNIAERRGDAVALLDVLDRTQKTSSAIIEWVSDTYGDYCKQQATRKGVSWNEKENYVGKYGAIFAPYFITSYINMSGAKIDKALFPCSLFYLACYAQSIQKHPSWKAVAGSVTGVCNYQVKPLIKFGDADIDALEPRELVTPEGATEDIFNFAINVICNIKPYGYVLWGNRTLYPLTNKSGDPTDTGLKASSFLNIRNLCSQLKKQIYRTCRRYTFETNSDSLWIKFNDGITPLLDKMKANEGVRDYMVSKVKTDQKALLSAKIQIIPIEAVEDFDIGLDLVDTIEITE